MDDQSFYRDMENLNRLMWFTIFSNDVEDRSLNGKKVNKEIRNNIYGNNYDILIAEDASGRIPGLITYRFLKKIIGNESSLSPKIYFIAGSHFASNIKEKSMKTQDYLEDVVLKNHDSDKRVLVVTEYIMEGDSLKPITDGLKYHRADYDVMTLGLCKGHFFMDNIRNKLGNVSAAKRAIPECIFKRGDLSGVVKNPNELLSIKYGTANQQLINKVRRETEVIANKLYESSKFLKDSLQK